jgi:tetratricopeptide (TPR) repeat protein
MEAAQKSDTREALLWAAKLVPDNAKNYRLLGTINQYSFIELNNDQAIQYYKDALKHHPLYTTAWLNMAHAYMAVEEPDKALTAINNVRKINPHNPDIIWETALFYLVNSNDKKRAIDYLRYYLSLKPAQQYKIYDIFYQMGFSHNFIVNTFLSDKPDLYIGYLKYLFTRKHVDKGIAFYNAFESLFIENIDRKYGLYVCKILLKKGMYDSALNLWRKVDNIKENDVYTNAYVGFSNGSFESDIKNKCFGWTVSKSKGVSLAMDISKFIHGQQSLSLSFAVDTEIPITLLKQFVVLQPGTKYLFTAHMMSQSITFPQGVFFEIKGISCPLLRLRSESISGTNLSWNTFNLTFSVPSGCKGAYIFLKRGGKKKFSQLIKSNLWIDGITLVESKAIHGTG